MLRNYLPLNRLLAALAFGHFSGCRGGEVGFHLRNHRVLLAALESRTCRDEAADDDVLLKTDEAGHGAGNGGFRKLTRRVLEGDGGEEGCACERDFGDTEQELFALRRLAP